MTKREVRRAIAQKFREGVKATSRLKTVFKDEYFASLEARVVAAGEELQLSNHVFFFTFWDRPEVLDELEKATLFIEKVSGKSIQSKLKMLAGSHADVVSTVFELLVLHRLIEAGALKKYEPPISSSSNEKAEAIVELRGERVLVEVQSKKQGELPSNPDDDHDVVEKLHGKLMAKCTAGQLANASMPGVLFQDTDFGVFDRHIDAVIKKAENDPNCKSASAIVFADRYTAKKFRVWINPNATHPVSPDAAARLKEIFE